MAIACFCVRGTKRARTSRQTIVFWRKTEKAQNIFKDVPDAGKQPLRSYIFHLRATKTESFTEIISSGKTIKGSCVSYDKIWCLVMCSFRLIGRFCLTLSTNEESIILLSTNKPLIGLQRLVR